MTASTATPKSPAQQHDATRDVEQHDKPVTEPRVMWIGRGNKRRRRELRKAKVEGRS